MVYLTTFPFPHTTHFFWVVGTYFGSEAQNNTGYLLSRWQPDGRTKSRQMDPKRGQLAVIVAKNSTRSNQIAHNFNSNLLYLGVAVLAIIVISVLRTGFNSYGMNIVNYVPAITYGFIWLLTRWLRQLPIVFRIGFIFMKISYMFNSIFVNTQTVWTNL